MPVSTQPTIPKSTTAMKRGVVPTAAMLVFATLAMTAVSSTTMLLAAAAPLLLRDDEPHGTGDESSGASTLSLGGEIEALLSAGAAASIPTSVASVSLSASVSPPTPSATDCTDDPEFVYKGKEACKWAKKRKRKRCKKVYLDAPIAERCRETCDYEKCRTILEQKNRLLVGAYYYPWWGDDFHRGKSDNPHLYVRSQLSDPREFPALGEYDDTQPEVIAKHLKWSRQHNIKLWVTSWWGEGRRTDATIKNHILTHPQLRDHRIAIFYETTGRIRERDDYDLENVLPDLNYLCGEYFGHPNYYHILDERDGTNKPVVFVYLTRKLERLGLLRDVVSRMREGAREGGCGEVFIVGDQVFQGAPTSGDDADLFPFEILDAVTNYDVYGSLRGGKAGGYVGSRQAVENYYQGEQRQWKAVAKSKGCAFIPGVSPGFNDRGVRPEVEHVPLSRRLSPGAPEGSLFEAALQEGRTLVDPATYNLILINSFNEWHEDTQIEPVVAQDGSSGKDSATSLPFNLTFGLDYEAYGTLYLKIVKQQTKWWDVSSLAVPASSSSVAAPMAAAAATAMPPFDGGTGFGTGTGTTQEEDITTISDIIGQELY